MEGTWSEYVDLLSSASLDLYPENHGSFFTNKLIVPQQLPQDTYVALEEISYVNTMYNVKHSSNSLTIFDMLAETPPHSEANPNAYPLYGTFKYCALKEGYYSSFQQLCDMLNEAVKKSDCEQVKNRNVFSYDPITMKFSYDVEGLWLSLWLSGDILSILGIEMEKATNRQYVVIGKPKLKPTYEYPKSLIPKPVAPGEKETETRHFTQPRMMWDSVQKTKDQFEFVAQLTLVNSFVVYIDCIDSQVTGDCFSDALRIVPIKGGDKPGTTVVTHFTKPYFLRCNKRYIPSITIQIQDLNAQPIDFKQGIVRVKLRFTTQPPR